MPPHEPLSQSAPTAPASEQEIEAARANEWRKNLESIDNFVAHAQRSAQIDPVHYALDKKN